MSNSYVDPDSSTAFEEFLNSENGHIQQTILWNAIQPQLPTALNASLLDAACGTGWLSNALSKTGYTHIRAFDNSPGLLTSARKNYPQLTIDSADALQPLPYTAESFDCVIVSMALHDFSDLDQAIKNLTHVLKPHGRLIITIANPYYSYPVGIWKRSIIGKILRFKPALHVRPYHFFTQPNRLYRWRESLQTHCYSLQQYFDVLLKNNLIVKSYTELKTEKDSWQFNANYQLHRYPTLLLLVLEKPSK